MRGSVVHDLVRRAGNISVNVIAGEELAADPVPKQTVRTAERREPFQPRPYLMALLIVAVGLAAAKFIQKPFGIENVDLVFLTAVVGVAVRFGLWPSLLASVAASLCYNFFFLPPIYTFTITDPTNVAAFFFFMLIAILVSNVAARVRTQADTAIGRIRTTELLYAFSRKLAGTATLDDVLWATAYQTALMLKVRVVLLLPENGVLTVKAGYPPEDQLDQADLAAANWAWGNDRPAGRGSDTLPGAKRLFLPMRTGRGLIGVIGIDDDKTGPLLTPDQRRLLDALVDQGALAIERVLLVEDMDRVKRNVESDRLRSALLTSISHDLEDAAGFGARCGFHDARPRRRACGGREARSAGDRDRRIRAAQPLHRQSARHDQARIRRHQAEYRAARCQRSHRQRAAPRQQDPCPSQGVARTRGGLADARTRRRAVRAGIVQPVWTMPPNMRRRRPRSRSADGGTGDSSRSRFSTRARAFRVPRWKACSTSSTVPRRATTSAPGTGLGSAIARGFIEAMGGTIPADNRSDRSGAVLTIRLPVPPSASNALDTAA